MGNSAEFTFDKGNIPASKIEVKEVEEKKDFVKSYDIDYNAPYTDERSVTISKINKPVLYREANRSAIPEKVDYIGSSIISSRTLSSNKEELDAYFPAIIGLSPNDNSFMLRVKQYLSNIQIKVNSLGKTFNTSFYYYHYSDYKAIKEKEEAIEEKYKKGIRENPSKLKELLNQKISELNALESSKYKYGYPINTEDYLMYRHCLLYSDVAKDTAIINDNPSIRFYFRDDKKEADKLKKMRLEVVKAKSNYVEALTDNTLFKAIYIQYCIMTNRPVVSSLLEERIQQEINLDKFSESDPIKFNKLFADKDIKLKSTIEHLIAKGILYKSQYNQNITNEEGTLIGANIREAVAWFKDPENTSIVEAYYSQLRNS